MSGGGGAKAFVDGPGSVELVWRSLPLQAAFNPVTLQGAGFAFALLPTLERRDRERAPARAAELAGGFNANPYLATFALGAVAVSEGREPPERVARFLDLVRGPLGAQGDALFWGVARPALFVCGALAVAGGAPWWIALAVLVPYNALAFAARWTGVRAGLAHGLDVAAALGCSWIRRAPAPLRTGGALAIGVLAGLVFTAAAPRAGLGTAGVAAWPAAVSFALAVLLFVAWPRRIGWGLALLAAWALAAAASWARAAGGPW